MDPHVWIVYLLAAIGLSISPGPNGLLALSHGAVHGRRKAMYTILGGVIGFIIVIALSMFGIGALLKVSIVWLSVMKIIGGAYLIWLGMQVWRSPAIGVHIPSSTRPVSGWSLFRQGFLSAVTNPKGLLFFAAFLPQFIDPGRNLGIQFIVMAGTFAMVEMATELFIASVAQRISPWLGRIGRRFNQICGGIFVGIGAALTLRN
ncbi:LysE family translocator [Herbaspirillum sp. HC18]|nr:LysE family translocator [Herbaspirillum sp. HC18]